VYLTVLGLAVAAVLASIGSGAAASAGDGRIGSTSRGADAGVNTRLVKMAASP